MEEEKFTGFVSNIIFRNDENGYSVFEFSSEEAGEFTAVGVFPKLAQGENLSLTGSFIEHPTYGEQLKCISYEYIMPTDETAMERYLAGGAISGIGPNLAKRIIKKFHKDTFRIMEDEPERLAEIKGISERMARSIAKQMVEKRDLRKVSVFLSKYDITPNLAMKIFDKYGQDVYDVIKENPYRLAEDVEGVGFKTADRIALKVGFSENSDERIRACILYLLDRASGEGHTFLPLPILRRNLKYLIPTDDERLDDILSNLNFEKKIYIESSNDLDEEGMKIKRVYNSFFYHLERNVAFRLLSMKEDSESDSVSGTNYTNDSLSEESKHNEADDDIFSLIRNIESDEDITLDEKQREAVLKASRNKFFILTGGPGTGKTTTLKVMIEVFKSLGIEVFLSAPTGRAAKRMSEATGYEAKTIHRLLEVGAVKSSDGREFTSFNRNQDNPLECGALIIDEASMVDLPLFYSVLKALPDTSKLILVGDQNQLPSVGPGNVLKDILSSSIFPSVYLDTIFRQGFDSDIVKNAHLVNKGLPVTLDNKSKDFFFLEMTDTRKILSYAAALIKEKLPRYLNIDSSEIQLMCPSKKGNAGVPAVNQFLQVALNPPDEDKRERKYMDKTFREGDKVMQMKNNYDLEWKVYGKQGVIKEEGKGVYNGDIGIIKRIHYETSEIEIDFFPDRVVFYPFNALSDLDLSYAVTIHKSQGSEYEAVIIILLNGPGQLLNRNLLYTAITRAKKCVVILGEKEVFYKMEKNTTVAVRYSGLKDRLIHSPGV